MAGIATASLDVLYHEAPANKENYMDILTSAGMGLLVGYGRTGFSRVHLVYIHIYVYVHGIYLYIYIAGYIHKSVCRNLC